jgi:hypothetical protein
MVDTSSYHFTASELSLITTQQTGSPPQAWGRYIINRAGKNPEMTGSRELTAAELYYLRQNKISLIPLVAPSQTDLAGSYADGVALAKEAVAVLTGSILGFRLNEVSMQVLVFLDVENDSHPLSTDYLVGWCKGLNEAATSTTRFLPAVYTNGGISAQGIRKTLVAANGQCSLRGLWLASYRQSTALPNTWRDMRRDNQKRLTPLPDDIPIYLWQFSPSRRTDWNVVNPDLVPQLRSRSIQLWAP